MSHGRLIASGALGLMLLGLGPASAQAAVLDANCPGPPDGGSSKAAAQTFTAVHTGTLVRGEMFVSKSAGADFQMQILHAGPLGPTGGALGTTTIADSSIPNVPSPSPGSPSSPVDGTFTPGVSVVAGQQYAIILDRSGGGFLSKDRSGDPCPGSEWLGTAGGTWTAVDPGSDYPFSTYVNPPTPVPVKPTNDFTIDTLKGKLLTLTLPGPGTVDVAGGGGSKAVAAAKTFVKSTQTIVPAAGAITIPIRLTKRATASLRQKGKLKLSAAITYTPTGGDPKTLPAKLKLKRK
jgi:hypothetical protein